MFDAQSKAYLPTELCLQVKTTYAQIPTSRQLNEAKNPVKKVELVITGSEGDIFIDELDTSEQINQGYNKEETAVDNLHNGDG